MEDFRQAVAANGCSSSETRHQEIVKAPAPHDLVFHDPLSEDSIRIQPLDLLQPQRINNGESPTRKRKKATTDRTRAIARVQHDLTLLARQVS